MPFTLNAISAAIPIRVAILDASPLVLAALTRLIEADETLVCVGSASNGRAGLQLIERARPDAICCATQLPLLSSVELVRAVMSQFPLPILALQAPDETPASATGAPQISSIAAEMLREGAVDWMVKPAPQSEVKTDFAARVARIARVRALTRHRPRAENDAPQPKITAPNPIVAAPRPMQPRRASERPELIAIGASTGGPPVVLQLLRVFSPGSPPIVCVQHIASGFLAEMIKWLDAQCRVEVGIAREGEIARAGHVYFPAEDRHLQIAGNGRLRLSDAPPRAGHRPAVDVTFESVARSYGAGALAILLTGMGADGATGLGEIQRAGGATWAQAPATCVVAGMPGKAIELGAANSVFTPDEMAARLQAWS